MNDKERVFFTECEHEVAVLSGMKPASSGLTSEQAKRLADLHLALAQLYREIAGLKPVPTASHQRRVAGR